ncbi:nitrous oxide reductase accessory protein NosL [Maritalea sp.]|uniref:nitrous oxide reductase accessory protein NosL n=1 Tax=Maritalea sp. TaxID=2003361 RepID=UPI003EF64844
MINIKIGFVLIAALMLAGCSGEAAVQPAPAPIALTEEAAGHYCQMVILEHEGPKAQMYLAGMQSPLWFSQVRDGLAYIKSKEQTAEILVMYVNDMGEAKSWSEPGQDNWIRADEAFYVVGSDALGGMGAPEMAPFSSQEKATTFARARGGEVKLLSEISVEAVLAPIEYEEGSNQ